MLVNRNPESPDILSLEEIDLIQRLLILRKQKKVGPILAEFGKYWICSSEIDPQGTKVYYPYHSLKNLVEKLETESALSRKPVASTQTPSGSEQEGSEARLWDIERLINE